MQPIKNVEHDRTLLHIATIAASRD